MPKLPVKLKIGKNTFTFNTDLKSANKLENASKIVDNSVDATDLELRLVMLDDFADDYKVAQLNMDILSFAERMLSSGKRKEILNFINNNKHRFNPELKDGLKEVLSQYV